MKIKDLIAGTKVKCVHSADKDYIGKLAEIVNYINGNIKVRWLDGTKYNTIFNFPSSFELVKDNRAPTNQVNPLTLKEGDYVELLIPCFYEEGTKDALVKATLLNTPKPGHQVAFVLDEYIYDGDTTPGSITDQPNSIQRSYDKICLTPNSKCNNIWEVTFEDINISGNSEWDISHLYITKVLNKNEKKKENSGKIMSNDKLDFTNILAQDAGKAAIRSGATLGINGLKTGLKKLLAHEGIDGLGAEAIMNFFEGPIGEAMLRASLGYGLMYLPIPMIQENEYAQKLSEELRVSGMAKGIDKGAEVVQQFILPSLLESFQGTPLLESFLPAKETKKRVSEHVTTPKRVVSEEIKSESEKDQELDEELDEVKAPKAKQSKVTKS
jgi:hypothetical protein